VLASLVAISLAGLVAAQAPAPRRVNIGEYFLLAVA
jgi:hypothetical protein